MNESLLFEHAGFWKRTVVMAVFVTLLLFPFAGSDAAEGKRNPAQSPWAEFVEPDFPFFSSVLDARQLGDGWPTNNLTPRALILNLGNDCWAAFDIDLLRMAVIWEGKGVTPASMARNSYHDAGSKVPEGQEQLPQIVGTPWIANGIYAGWQSGERPALTDPREPTPDQREVGRGPLPESSGRFRAVRLAQRGVCLEYEVFGASVREWAESAIGDGRCRVERRFRLENVGQPLWLMLGKKSAGTKFALLTDQNSGEPAATQIVERDGVASVRVAPSSSPIEFGVAMSIGATNQIPLTRPSATLSPSLLRPSPSSTPLTQRALREGGGLEGERAIINGERAG